MRVAVLASPGSWYFADLLRAAGARHQLCCLPFSRLTARLDAEGRSVVASGDVPLSDFDAVLVRTMPPGSLEQVVFRMDALGQLASQGVPVINPPRALEAAVDKYLSSARLLEAGLPTPETIVCQGVDEAMTGFDRLGRDIVVKPLFGSEGRGILRVDEEGLALRVFKALAQLGSAIYLQRFIPHHGFDIRLLVIGSEVLCVRRVNPVDWRTNVSRGATAEAFRPDAELLDWARRAAEAIGAPLAGVDVLPARDGRRYVLEVNAVPGWQATARSLGADVASLVLDYLETLAAG